MSTPFPDDPLSCQKWKQNLKLEHLFLITFLKYTANRCFEYQNLEDLVTRAEAVDRRAQSYLNLHIILSRKDVERTLNNMTANVVDKVKLLKSEIREVHRIVSRSSQSHNCMSNELVIEFTDSLLENLKHLVSVKVDLLDNLKIKLEALEGKLRFLRTFLMFTEKRCTDREKINNLFTHAKVAAANAAYLSYSCLVGEMNEDMLEGLLFDLSALVLKIDPVTPEVRQVYIGVLKASSESSQPDLYTSERDEIAVDFMESLLKNVAELLCAGLIVPIRDQIGILQEELAFLRSFIMDPPNQYTDTETLSDLLRQSKLLSTKAGSLVYSLYDNAMNVETTEKVYSSLFDLQGEIKLFKVEITEIYLKVPKLPCPKFPTTDELGFLDCLLGNLRGLLSNRSDSITCLNLQVEQLGEELKFLISFLGNIAKQHAEQEKLKVLWRQTVDVAYKTEYIIDSLWVGNGHVWHRMLWLSEVRKEIEVLKAEVNKIGEEKTHDSKVHHDAKISGQASSQATTSEMDDVVVGFEDEEGKMVEDLVRGSARLEMVSIVGMPGLGKTHLAKTIYNNPIVKDYFYVRAWCYVSQVYNRKHLLTRILSQVVEPTKRMSEMTDEDLAEVLYKNLKGKRYLILLDDLWEAKAWNALRRSLPDDNNGSRVMFTSRFHNLGMRSSRSKIHHLRPFSDDESWKLLQEKLFQSESCPSELLEVGKQIARNCHGLPLAVVVVAGILARIDQKRHQWREVANSQCSYIINDPKRQSIKVIELSYKHLPNYLKPCFLYIGAFLKNKNISLRKLIWLMIAEGFVQKVEQKSLENIAEDYLMDLVGRSLVIIGERRSTGDIKECLVHDLVRDFCVKKAKEDNFLQLIERPPTSDSSRHIIYEQGRIGCNQPGHFLEAEAYGPHVRSLLFFSPTYFHTRGCDVSSFCDKFKLLRVLNLACIRVQGTFPDGISLLAHLRYLAMCGDFGYIPSSIAKLWNLETFIVEGSTSLIHLPHTIWNMVKLRHIHISESVIFSRPSFCPCFPIR